jgi:hypothetical protein
MRNADLVPGTEVWHKTFVHWGRGVVVREPRGARDRLTGRRITLTLVRWANGDEQPVQSGELRRTEDVAKRESFERLVAELGLLEQLRAEAHNPERTP